MQTTIMDCLQVDASECRELVAHTVFPRHKCKQYLSSARESQQFKLGKAFMTFIFIIYALIIRELPFSKRQKPSFHHSRFVFFLSLCMIPFCLYKPPPTLPAIFLMILLTLTSGNFIFFLSKATVHEDIKFVLKRQVSTLIRPSKKTCSH